MNKKLIATAVVGAGLVLGGGAAIQGSGHPAAPGRDGGRPLPAAAAQGAPEDDAPCAAGHQRVSGVCTPQE